MGTLDDAIREHLELKRQHGAGDDEIKEAEAEAFGSGEDLPEVPGAAVTAPAGEGDQLDKVFSPSEEPLEPAPEALEETPETETSPEAEEVSAEAEIESDRPDTEQEGDAVDAGDALEQERDHLLGHPTENYDVDAAIAEEEELDLLSESRLSDELDRALGGPEEIPPAPAPIEVEPARADEPSSAELDLDEAAAPVGEVVEERIDVEEEVAIVEEDVEVVDLPEPDFEPISEDPIAEDSDSGEIPLDDTPDFLEDSPEGEDLWFEQKEPKDFDFGD